MNILIQAQIPNYERFLYDFEERVAIMLENNATLKEAAWQAYYDVLASMKLNQVPHGLAVRAALQMRTETLKEVVNG